MKLDEGYQDQKLSLDVTPLIDIAFILVLFFAVSTSFISGADLAELKDNLFNLGEAKKTLTAENSALTSRREALESQLAQREEEVRQLERSILETGANTEKLEWMIKTLREQKLELEGSLATAGSETKGLREQLEQAYADFQALDLRLTGLKTDLDVKEENEKLLRALLLERESERDALAGRLNQAEQSQESAAARTSALQDERQALADLLASRTSELEEAETLLADQDAQEKLLQQLLAERAAALSDMEVRLVKAGEENQRLSASMQSLEAGATEQQSRTSALETELLKLRNELTRYQEIARLGEDQIERLLKAQENLEAGLEADLAANRLGIKRENQRLVVQLSNRILFDSGSAQIKGEGVRVLRKVGEIINSRTGTLDVQIGGHTDNVPMAADGAAAGVATAGLSGNWGLSSARAVNVVRFLEDEVGIDPARLSAVGYGEHRPVASNDEARGRSLNRRIEIVLVPR